MTMIRRSYRIDAIKNRRSRRIAAKVTVFLQPTKHTISRKRRSYLSNHKTKVILDEKMSKSLRSRIVLFKDFSKKSSLSQDSKKKLALKTPERNSIQVMQKSPSLQRSPCSNLHKDILKKQNKNQESKDILALQSSQRKTKVFLLVPLLRRSPRRNQVKTSLRRSPRCNLFMHKQQ